MAVDHYDLTADCTQQATCGNSFKSGGPQVTDEYLRGISMTNGLRHIVLNNCSNLTDVSPLTEIVTLEEVYIYSCKHVRYFGTLGQRPLSLKKLVLTGTPVTDVQLNEIHTGTLDVVTGDRQTFHALGAPTQSLVKASLDLIRDLALKYKPERIGIAFNGGKDSMAMMDLLLCALGLERMQKCCTFTLGFGDDSRDFTEVELMREEYAKAHGLQVVKPDPSLSLKDGLAYLKKENDLEVVFMGTRSVDSAHQKTSVEPTTAGWPSLLRACPVFEWTYKDIWGYTLAYGVPFCPLYAQGYTSLGHRSCTLPNPVLRREDGTFRPAWELQDASLERASRAVRL